MRVGYAALVGRPNVGKSTLLNRLIGQKLSIVSFRPQTTRHRILGIKTTGEAQVIFVDTPGLHDGGKRAINRYLNKTAASATDFADVIVWVVDAPEWRPGDELVADRLRRASSPVILAINKIDQISDKERLLPFLAAAQEGQFHDIVPISAAKGTNIEALESAIIGLLPDGEPVYAEDQLSDRPIRFFVAEIIREKLLTRLQQEVPHALTVEIESFQEAETLTTIHAVIWVERQGQKGIVIGKGGELLKAVGTAARRDLERTLECRVNLQLWVKVREGWSDSDAALRSLGYAD